MQFCLEKTDCRIGRFVEYFVEKTSSDPDRKFSELKSKSCKLADLEERLFFILLATHFDSPSLADDFYQGLSWNIIQQIDDDGIRKVCEEYFSGKSFTGERLIGEHRRYFRCLSNHEKINYSVEILMSYKQVIGKYGSQRIFFEIDNNDADFDVLYQRMKEIAHFDTRLPRFDHLEKVSRLHHFYVIPNRFYAEEATGPFYGLTYLLLGKRLGKDEQSTRQDLDNSFIQSWNEQVGGEYTVPDKANFGQIVECLELWVLNRIRNWESLPEAKRNYPAFVFDVESCLCNWQKSVKVEC